MLLVDNFGNLSSLSLFREVTLANLIKDVLGLKQPVILCFVCLSVCLLVCLFVPLFICLLACLFVCLLDRSIVCLFVCLSVCLFVCLLLNVPPTKST